MTLFQPRRARETRAGVYLSPSLMGRHPRHGLGSTLNTTISAEQAQRHSAVFASRDLIATLVSSLPYHEYKITDDRLVRVKNPAPWLETPDGDRDFWELAYVTLDSALARGIGCARVTSIGPDGWPATLEDLDPNSVRFTRVGSRGQVTWTIDGAPAGLWPAGPLWMLRGHPLPGRPDSVSPIEYAAQTIYAGLAAQDFGTSFFDANGLPVAVLETDAEMAPGARAKALDDWEAETTGNRKVRLLSHGIKLKPLMISPEEAQFLDTIQASVETVGRFFRVDPRDIGSAITGAGSLTYSNPELDQLRLLVRTLAPWVVRLETRLSRLRPRGRVIRADLNSFLRVDTTTRHKVYESAVRSGWLSVNEIRQLENRPDIGSEGDTYLWPPYRGGLDTPEMEQGADGDATGQASALTADPADDPAAMIGA